MAATLGHLLGAAGTHGRSSSRDAAFKLALHGVLEATSLLDEASSTPRASAPQPAASATSVSCVPRLHDLADGAFDAAIGLVCKGLLPEGPGVPTPLEQHGRPCFVCRFVESDVQHE